MTLNHKIYGQGDPIIILHGLFGTLDNWQSIARKLEDDYTVITIDQRDHGKSPHTEDFNYSLLAEDLHEFMSANWIHKAHIVGHSMGGKTAMMFASMYPDMVDKLVVVDIGPQAYQRGHDVIFEALKAADITSTNSRTDVEDVISSYIDDKGVVLFLMKNLHRAKGEGFQWKANIDLLYEKYDSIIAALPLEEVVDIDTLFLYGSNSNYIKPQDFPQIERLFPKVKFESLPTGHWIHAEMPDQFVDTLKSFLD